MAWLKFLPQIINFLVSELPKFVKQLKLANKDRKYENKVEHYNDALSLYKKEKSLDALNNLSK